MNLLEIKLQTLASKPPMKMVKEKSEKMKQAAKQGMMAPVMKHAGKVRQAVKKSSGDKPTPGPFDYNKHYAILKDTKNSDAKRMKSAHAIVGFHARRLLDPNTSTYNRKRSAAVVSPMIKYLHPDYK